ncbi:MAG: zinc dependent phospholipase C family protein [Thermodesulfobacteriota bacterium]
MPKEQTHFILAGRAVEALGEGLVRKAVTRAPNLFLLGAVIMDTPLYALSEKEICFPLTERLHGQEGENPFLDTARVLEEFGPRYPDEATSFCMGVVSHVMADASFHPFVTYISGNCHHPLSQVRSLCLARHRRAETLLDTLFLKVNQLVKARTFYRLTRASEVVPEVLRGMAMSLFGVSGERWDRRVRHMMASHGFLQAMFMQHPISHVVHWVSRHLAGRVEGLDALFYPYDGKKPQISPDEVLSYVHPVTGRHRETTLGRLSERAVRSAAEIFRAISRYSNTTQAAEHLRGIRAPSPETGLPGVGAREMVHFNQGIDIEGLFRIL